jgi:GTPase involved in cell partitioning and DNA repair
MIKIFWTVFAFTALVGCTRLAEPPKPKPQSTQLVEMIRVQRHKLALIRADIKVITSQLDELEEELRDTEIACRLNAVEKCATEAISSIKTDLENDLQDSHEQLRIEGAKLDELISQLLR